jgi:outer membrane protein OmpA-like peptidoglycan-associated protein
MKLSHIIKASQFKTEVVLIILSFLGVLGIHAQNLVINPGFENFKHIPSASELKKYAVNPPVLKLSHAEGWTVPFENDGADLYSETSSDTSYKTPRNEAGSQVPRSGKSYAGIFIRKSHLTDYREYIQGKLSEPMQKGKLYHISFYVSLSDKSRLASSSIGMYISGTDYTQDQKTKPYLQFRPQIVSDSTKYLSDKKRWMKVSGTYWAKGGEEYFILGLFKNDKRSDFAWINDSKAVNSIYESYYYIDDVCISATASDCKDKTDDLLVLKNSDKELYYQKGNMTILGKVTDKLTGTPLSARLVLHEINEEDNAARFGSGANGKFMVSRKVARYYVFVGLEGYIPKAAYVTPGNFAVDINFKLAPMKRGATSELLNYYDIIDGETKFIRFCEEEIGHLAEFLSDNPGLKIRINSHGYIPSRSGLKDSEEDILWETNTRARQLAELLLDYGANSWQISYKGFGTSVKGQQYMNEIEVISFDPVGKVEIPKFRIKAEIFNALTREPVSCIYYINNLKTHNNLIGDAMMGITAMMVKPGEYTFTVNDPNYLPFSKFFKVDFDDVELEIPLVKIDKDNRFTLRNIQFPANSAQIDTVSYPILDMIYKLLVQKPDIKLLIEGHTDGSNDRTNDAYLVELSKKRAESVKQYLTEKGISANRLETIGYGRTKPLGDNTTVEGRNQNRRIEFQIIESAPGE